MSARLGLTAPALEPHDVLQSLAGDDLAQAGHLGAVAHHMQPVTGEFGRLGKGQHRDIGQFVRHQPAGKEKAPRTLA